MTFRQGQEMTLTLTLKTHKTSLSQYVFGIYQPSGLYLLTFRSQASKRTEIHNVSRFFFHSKVYVTKIDLAIK